MQGEDASLLWQATSTSAPEISTAQIWTEESHPWAASTTNGRRAGRILRHQVFIIARRSRGVLPLPTVQVADGKEVRRGRDNRLTAVDEDTDAAQPTCCQSEADSKAPAAYPCISEAPRLCTRRRMRSSCAKWADSGTLRIITRTRQKSDLASTWSTRGMRKPGSPSCCNGTFHCPNSLATTLPKTSSSTFGTFRGVRGRLKQRKRRRDSKRKKLRSRRTPDAVWIFIKLIGLGSKNMLEYEKKKTCINAQICKTKYAQVCIFKICINLPLIFKRMLYMLEYAWG